VVGWKVHNSGPQSRILTMKLTRLGRLGTEPKHSHASQLIMSQRRPLPGMQSPDMKPRFCFGGDSDYSTCNGRTDRCNCIRKSRRLQRNLQRPTQTRAYSSHERPAHQDAVGSIPFLRIETKISALFPHCDNPWRWTCIPHIVYMRFTGDLTVEISQIIGMPRTHHAARRSSHEHWQRTGKPQAL
jgi:hypothetical protein